MDGETGYIPKSLDASERFLWWKLDQLIMAIMLIGIGVAAGSITLGVAAGTLSAWQYGRLKAGKHPKFAVHALYWWLPGKLVVKPRATPPSHLRYFLG